MSGSSKLKGAPSLLKKPTRPRTSGRSWVAGAVVASLVIWLYDKALVDEYMVCSSSRNIYTVDPSNPRVECVLVKGHTILDTGNLQDIQSRSASTSYTGVLTQVLRTIHNDYKVFHVDPKSIVVPGLADAHAHILQYGSMMELPLATATSIQDVIQRIKEYILAHPEIQNDKSRWIEGMGWDQTKWSGAEFPTAADLDLDPLLKGRPISLSRIDVHAQWVSPRVLELMGDLPLEVEGGQIIRDGVGNPTGIFVDNAMALIPVPAWNEERMAKFFDTTMKAALAHGLTSIHDASSPPEYISFYKKKAEEGNLPNRLYLMGNAAASSEGYWGAKVPRLINYGKHGRLNVRSVKLFTDGALGSWGAALLAPYSDKPETSGLILTSPEEMSSLIHQFWKDGFQTNIHCIGDRANHVVLDILESIIVGKNANVTGWRPRIEHAQIFSLEDLKRMEKLGVIASVQPTHATSDMSYAETRLGSERIKGAYAYQTLLQLSPINVLPIGSDFPVESINPLLGFYAAVARLYTDGTSPHGPGGWFPEQRLTRAQALKGMTLDAAYASFSENELGSLTPGKRADFVVLDRDIMTIPFADILPTKVSATVIDGKVAYGAL
ncbi:amidohydrolase family-domain-containing protein [Collybia nuda]|uniref:Amidohydrolase family-domain-containing protein n=1 Tax=Collybia nuda TaxID=64659 RepID=A0A9P5Y2W4_9AGAR|nr:amidohydrolase family-domain-containing protein [Collybia nuda]